MNAILKEKEKRCCEYIKGAAGERLHFQWWMQRFWKRDGNPLPK
jgi:hypothetical protein